MAIRTEQPLVERYLGHRSPLVRSEAAQALSRARVGSDAIHDALQKEHDFLVLASLCEAALQTGDRESVFLLKKLCRHPSWLVRKHAAWAVAEIEEARSSPFLRHLLASEKSRRVRPVLQAGLLKWGGDDVLPALLSNLQSRDYLVRCITANLFAQNIERRVRGNEVVAALKEALAKEDTAAAREAITNAIKAWR